jgi:hypothetical protein
VLHIDTAVAHDVRWRVRSLERDFATLKEGAAAGDRGVVQDALDGCLNMLHQLDDDHEFSNRRWGADDRALWTAHQGARSAAHHESVSLLSFRLRSGGPPIPRWNAPPESVRRHEQQREYRYWLYGNEVIPPLARIVALVRRTVPSA